MRKEPSAESLDSSQSSFDWSKETSHHKQETDGSSSRMTLSPTSVVEHVHEEENNHPHIPFVDWLLKHIPAPDSPNADSLKDQSTSSNSSLQIPQPEKATIDSPLHVNYGGSRSSSDLKIGNHPIQALRRVRTTPPRHPLSSSQAAKANPPLKTQDDAIASSWNAKGLRHAKKEQWQGAIQCWKRALQLRTEALGKTHPDVANTLNNMGIAYGQLGSNKEAMDCLVQALAIRTKNYGPTHQDTAATHHNIGNLRQATGDLDGALGSFIEAQRIQQSLCPQGKSVARAWNAVGHVYFEKKEHAKARDAYRQARDAFVRAGVAEDNGELKVTQLDLEEVEEILKSSQ